MASANGPVHLERVEASLNDNVTYPYMLTTTWEGSYSATGSAPFDPFVIVVKTPLVDTSPLDQTAWDHIFADFGTAWAAVTGGSAPTVNPVVI